MANIFEEALSQLMTTMSECTDVDVVYKHAGVEYPIQATCGNINFGTLNKVGDVALGENFREYIIRSTWLAFAPVNGDTIVDGADTFEVYNPDTSSKCWRYSDPYKGLMRIYTRRISK